MSCSHAKTRFVTFRRARGREADQIVRLQGEDPAPRSRVEQDIRRGWWFVIADRAGRILAAVLIRPVLSTIKRVGYRVSTPLVSREAPRGVRNILTLFGVGQTAIEALIEAREAEWLWIGQRLYGPAALNLTELTLAEMWRLDTSLARAIDPSRMAWPLEPIQTPKCAYIKMALNRLAGAATEDGYYSVVGDTIYLASDALAMQEPGAGLWWKALAAILLERDLMAQFIGPCA